MADAVSNRPRQRLPRPTKELSWELANHAKAYLEAQQYANGYDFLHSLLAAGTSISVPAKPYPGFLAPAAQLALASTLIVYPAITTKAKSAEVRKGSDAALSYLRCVHNTIEGPAYSTIRKAFSFLDERTRRRAPAHRSTSIAASPASSTGGDVEQLKGSAANAQSLWYRADDFWHVVGWAFNCSSMHKKRWERWRLWLHMMLDFLQDDWADCVRAGNKEGADKESILRSTLLWQYIDNNGPVSRNSRRKMLRAILATADSQSLQNYPEVWENETAEPKKTDGDINTVATIDIANGQLGDYGFDDEDVVMHDAAQNQGSRKSPSSPPTALDNNTITSLDDAVGRLGGADAVQLRQRFIALLAQVAQRLPGHFTELEDYLDNVTEELRGLPMLIFKVLISTSRLPSITQMALNANLLLPFTARQLPNYTKILPSQSHMETYWLPLRATNQSFVASAKISIIIEQMFMYMMEEDLLNATDSLRAAAEAGIEARQRVYGTGRGKKGNAQEEERGRELMHVSSERLLGLLEILEIASGREPQRRISKKESLFLLSSFSSSLSSPPRSDDEDDG